MHIWRIKVKEKEKRKMPVDTLALSELRSPGRQ
jgi:hypothetical protein